MQLPQCHCLYAAKISAPLHCLCLFDGNLLSQLACSVHLQLGYTWPANDYHFTHLWVEFEVPVKDQPAANDKNTAVVDEEEEVVVDENEAPQKTAADDFEDEAVVEVSDAFETSS